MYHRPEMWGIQGKRGQCTEVLSLFIGLLPVEKAVDSVHNFLYIPGKGGYNRL